MRNLIFVILTFAMGLLFAFTKHWNSPVKGRVNPEDAALRVWIFGADTLSATINSGYFQIDNAKPGSYVLLIQGKPPYRNMTKDGIVVADGQPTDVGTIEMQK
jgi:hypothetical protein